MTRTMRHFLGIGALGLGGILLATPALAEQGQKGGRFQMMDSNKDGRLTAEEHAAGARQMFDAMDADRDGKVSAAEMDAFKAQMGKDKGKQASKGEMSSAEKIKEIDTNNDGMLTSEEHAAGARRMFDRMDTNSDGYLVKSELEAGHDKLMKSKSGMGTQPQPSPPPQQPPR